jgi:replicative DNA helicase
MTPKPFGNQKAPQNSGAERWLLGAILLDPPRTR